MKFKKIYGFALAVAFAGALSSCSNELHEPTNPDNTETTGYKLVKEPSVTAWTGSLAFGTRSAYMNANMYNQDWDCVPNVDLTAEELEELKALLSPGHFVENDIILPFENYWVQQVFKGTDTYIPTDINGNPVDNRTVTGSDQMDKLIAHNLQTEYKQVWSQENNWSGEWEYVTTEYEHVNNFNNGNNTNTPGQCGCGITHIGTTLMINMSTEGITPTNQFGFHESFGTSHDYNNYIIVKYKGEWYVGFDYEMHKSEAQNANEAKDVERDWCFTDWIVKITPAYHLGETPEIPETPDSSGSLPQVKEKPDGHSEVEINFAINDPENQGDIEHLITKLSIHVRYAGDVEVFIPAGAEVYLDTDDLAIFNKHEDDFSVYGGPIELIYPFGENSEYSVTLTVAFEENGIRVTTEGINESVFDYCQRNFKDGINFEIYNYFNIDALGGSYQAAVEQFKLILDQDPATVEFLGVTKPHYYINAFTTHEGQKWNHDCKVSIIGEQVNDFNEAQEGNHLNNSKFNEIYKNKSVTDNEGVEHRHDFLWKDND